MRRDYFIFGGVNSLDFGVILQEAPVESLPEPENEYVSVPGRNGDLLRPGGRWKNIKVSYSGAIVTNFAENFGALRQRMLSQAGYQRLEDTLHPEWYRMAALSGGVDPALTPYNRAGTFALTFSAKPQRYLKTGETPIQVETGQTLHNPWMPALPLIRVTGNGDGQLVVGSSTITITGLEGGITIDSDTQNAYDDARNLNNSISVVGGFPTLSTGKTAVSFSGGITAVQITPRWWTI